MARVANIWRLAPAAILVAVCSASLVTASPATAAVTHRVRYLERRLEVARTELADTQAKLVTRYEHRLAMKNKLVGESRLCSSGRSEALQSECRARVAQAVEQLEQELALAREHKLARPLISALERRIARLERELAAAREH